MTELRSEVTVEDPPNPQVTRYDWVAIADKVRRTPNRWHSVFKGDRASLAAQIRQGDVAALREDRGFETTTRNNRRPAVGPRVCDLYVRYVPANDNERSKK